MANPVVFIVPSASSLQRLDDIKKQMETLQHSIADKQQKGLAVSDSEKASLAFLRAQHDNLDLWQKTLAPHPIPGGMTILNQSGEAVYSAQLSDGAPPPPPSFPDIEPIKTIYPVRRSARVPPPSLPANVTVTIMASKPRKGGKKRVPPPVAKQQEVLATRRVKKAVSGLTETLGYKMMNGNAVILDSDGAVRINGTLYVPNAFRWWKDVNGNKFFVYIPACIWNHPVQAWAMRILFSVPGMHAFYNGFTTDPCFERVGSLHTLVEMLLSRLWYVQSGASYPKATVHRIPSDVKHFPLPKKFDGFRKGNEVFVRRSSFQHGYVRDVYVLPDKTRLYLVLASCAEIPDFRLGVSPWMETLAEDDLCPPRIYWKPIHTDARWWDRFDITDPKYITGYWPAPKSGWKVGHYVSAPASVLDRDPARRLGKIVFVSEHNEFADVVYPLDPRNPEQAFKKNRIPVPFLLGPAIAGPDFASLEWLDEDPAKDRPVSPLDLGASALPETGKRTRVLSDPSTCIQPVKVLKTEQEQAEPPELEPADEPPQADVDVSGFFIED